MVFLFIIAACQNPFWPGRYANTGNTGDTGDTGESECVHDWELTQTISATCTSGGEETYTCALCHEENKLTLPRLEHGFEWVETPGYETETCKLCGFKSGNIRLTLNVGDIGPSGGKIFYRSDEGFPLFKGTSPDIGNDESEIVHYLESAPETVLIDDLGKFVKAKWGEALVDEIPEISPLSMDPYIPPYPYGIYEYQNQIGYGLRFTIFIANKMESELIFDTAAQKCLAANHGGLDDWFLPSMDELIELNKLHTDPKLMYGPQLSSSQVNETQAWNLLLYKPDYWVQGKSVMNNFWPVRAF